MCRERKGKDGGEKEKNKMKMAFNGVFDVREKNSAEKVCCFPAYPYTGSKEGGKNERPVLFYINAELYTYTLTSLLPM